MSDVQSNPYDQPARDLTFSPEEPAKSRGCFFYGCIIAIILFVLGLILMGVVSYIAYAWTGKMIKEYTSTSPVVLPEVNLPEADRKAITERAKAFKEAVDKGEAAELTLTADEINALINETPELKKKFYISIKDNKISGKMSFPLDDLPLGLGKGRFLNGSATLTVSLRDGELVVHATEFEVNGKSPPPEMMAQFKNENLAKSVANNPENREFISRFDTIEIKDNKVHLKARSKSAEAEADEAKDKGKGDEEKPQAKDDPDMPRVDKDQPGARDDEDTPKPDSPKLEEKKDEVPPAEKKAAA